jgi:hypothetical protein
MYLLYIIHLFHIPIRRLTDAQVSWETPGLPMTITNFREVVGIVDCNRDNGQAGIEEEIGRAHV